MDKECTTCVWFDGDFRDGERYCDYKEIFVTHYNWCPSYREDDFKIKLVNELKEQNK